MSAILRIDGLRDLFRRHKPRRDTSGVTHLSECNSRRRLSSEWQVLHRSPQTNLKRGSFAYANSVSTPTKSDRQKDGALPLFCHLSFVICHLLSPPIGYWLSAIGNPKLEQLVRIDINAHLHFIWKRKAIDHFLDRSREPEDSAGTQHDLEPIKPFHPFDLGGNDSVKRHR
jgi:hypothetical protein